jgi:hypothetical protein
MGKQKREAMLVERSWACSCCGRCLCCDWWSRDLPRRVHVVGAPGLDISKVASSLRGVIRLSVVFL